MTDIFGTIISGSQIEDAVIAQLELWLPVYITEMEVQLGMVCGNVPAPRSYQPAKDLELFEENQLPACIVMSPGISGKPRMEGDGNYSAAFRVVIGVLTSARDQDSTRTVAKLYGA